jgi:hypothetical protein
MAGNQLRERGLLNGVKKQKSSKIPEFFYY